MRRALPWSALLIGAGLLGAASIAQAQSDAGVDSSEPTEVTDSAESTEEETVPVETESEEPVAVETESVGEEGAHLPPVPPAPSGSADPPLHAVVIDAAPHAVDALVARHVTARIRRTLRDMGYLVVDRDYTVSAARQAGMQYPPSPAELWRITYAARAHRGAFARVWAERGEYVVEMVVASLDETGPFFARQSATAEQLHTTVEQLVREAMPPVERWNAEAYQRLAQPRSIDGAERFDESDFAEPTPAERLGRHSEPELPPQDVGRRFSLALQSDSAIGTSDDRFINQSVGLRIDYRISREIMLGLYLGYANLRGRGQRASNLLPYAQVENRVALGQRTDITVPLRFGLGYLPFNGPFVRIAAGFNFPVSERIEIGLDLLTPTFWVLQERTAVSLNLGVEIIARL